MSITEGQLLEVIARAPLVSIDLIIRDANGKILLGLRTNEPAQGKWFVPGGRIQKNESLDEAFQRISLAELGEKFDRSDARFIGVYEHKYDTNFLGRNYIGTHYVVLAYEIFPLKSLKIEAIPTAQHSKFDWFSQDDAKDCGDVHSYVLPYTERFDEAFAGQYAALNARRDSFNSLLWQTPVLSLTAQAFLFMIALSSNVSNDARIIAAFLSIIVALASIQLMIKHRFSEKDHAQLLQRLEKERGLLPINRWRGPKPSWWNPKTWIALSSVGIWVVMMIVFGFWALLILTNPFGFIIWRP